MVIYLNECTAIREWA